MEITSKLNDAEQLVLQMQALRRRVQELYKQGGAASQFSPLLSEAFGELEHALEQLDAARQLLQQQKENWLDERTQLYTELLRYKVLFDQAPCGYIISSLDGGIRQVNTTTLEVFQAEERHIIGRSLALFVPNGQRRTFRAEIAALRELQHIQVWERELQTWQGTPFMAKLSVAVVRGAKGRPAGLRWLIQHNCSCSDR